MVEGGRFCYAHLLTKFNDPVNTFDTMFDEENYKKIRILFNKGFQLMHGNIYPKRIFDKKYRALLYEEFEFLTVNDLSEKFGTVQKMEGDGINYIDFKSVPLNEFIYYIKNGIWSGAMTLEDIFIMTGTIVETINMIYDGEKAEFYKSKYYEVFEEPEIKAFIISKLNVGEDRPLFLENIEKKEICLMDYYNLPINKITVGRISQKQKPIKNNVKNEKFSKKGRKQYNKRKYNLFSSLLYVPKRIEFILNHASIEYLEKRIKEVGESIISKYSSSVDKNYKNPIKSKFRRHKINSFDGKRICFRTKSKKNIKCVENGNGNQIVLDKEKIDLINKKLNINNILNIIDEEEKNKNKQINQKNNYQINNVNNLENLNKLENINSSINNVNNNYDINNDEYYINYCLNDQVDYGPGPEQQNSETNYYKKNDYWKRSKYKKNYHHYKRFNNHQHKNTNYRWKERHKNENYHYKDYNTNQDQFRSFETRTSVPKDPDPKV